jgi:hypothetical protein|tara:strand:- start:13435 stop:13650 length:216 start_codon:yes stop_codon:yes gene_type:complete
MIDHSDCPSDHGYFHESELPDLDHLTDHVKGILEAIYSTGDCAQLERCLEEVCGELNIAFEPTFSLSIQVA